MLAIIVYPLMWLAAAALPALVAVYLLHHRFRHRDVSSLMLWAEGRQLSEGGRRVRRLQIPWMLLLELLILLLLVLAGLDVRWQSEMMRRRIVVVLDDSASMRAVGSGGQSAQERAMGLLSKELAGHGDLLTRALLAGSETVPVEGESAKEILDGIKEQWTCLQGSCDLGGALALAGRTMPDARVLVLTDCAPPAGIDDDGRVVWLSAGEASENLALIGAARSDDLNGGRCLVQIANYGSVERASDVQWVTQDGRSALEHCVVPADGEVTLSRRVSEGAGDVRVALTTRDSLGLDDGAWLLAEGDAALRVSVEIGKERTRELVARALEATGRVRLVGEHPALRIVAGGAGRDPGGWMVRLRSQKGAVSCTGPFVLEAGHSLVDGLSFDGVVWGASTNVASAVRPIVAAGAVPLLWLTPVGDDGVDATMQFVPEASTLQNSPAWPALFWNLVEWRVSARPGFALRHVRPGVPMRLRASGGAEEVDVTDPAGAQMTLPGGRRELLVDARIPGVYTAVQAGWRSRSALNFLAPGESDLRGRRSGRWGDWGNSTEMIESQRSSAPWLFLAALALLAVHHRMLVRPQG